MSINEKNIRFIDSHCHLDFPELEENLREIMLLAKQFSIEKF